MKIYALLLQAQFHNTEFILAIVFITIDYFAVIPNE